MRAETIRGGLYCRSTHNGRPPDKTRAVVPRSDQTASPGANELTPGIGTARVDPAPAACSAARLAELPLSRSPAELTHGRDSDCVHYTRC